MPLPYLAQRQFSCWAQFALPSTQWLVRALLSWPGSSNLKIGSPLLQQGLADICCTTVLPAIPCQQPLPFVDRVHALQHIQPPGTLDGGDVLQLPGSRHILVGLSTRTNESAFQQLQQLLPQHALHAVPVAKGLHLKSACTALDSRTMLYADNEAGRGLKSILQDHMAFSPTAGSNGGISGSSEGPWQHVLVDAECSNVLLLGRHVVMRGGFPESERVLERLAAAKGLQLHKLEYGEFAKADGSLTCCSIVLPP